MNLEQLTASITAAVTETLSPAAHLEQAMLQLTQPLPVPLEVLLWSAVTQTARHSVRGEEMLGSDDTVENGAYVMVFGYSVASYFEFGDPVCEDPAVPFARLEFARGRVRLVVFERGVTVPEGSPLEAYGVPVTEFSYDSDVMFTRESGVEI